MLGLMDDLDGYRTLNLLESIIVEDNLRNKTAPEDERQRIAATIKSLRSHDIINSVDQESGRTSDVRTNRRPPRLIEPTDMGYPGLEPPVG